MVDISNKNSKFWVYEEEKRKIDKILNKEKMVVKNI